MAISHDAVSLIKFTLDLKTWRRVGKGFGRDRKEEEIK